MLALNIQEFNFSFIIWGWTNVVYVDERISGSEIAQRSPLVMMQLGELVTVHWPSTVVTQIRNLTHRHTHTWPFYGPFSGSTQVSRRQKKSSGLYGAREDNRGRHTDRLDGHHSIRNNQRPTSIIPPFLCRMPFLAQPSHFILAWDGHQIC